MKKGLKNSLITLGLTGALALTGCQNPTYWSVPNQRGQTTYENRTDNLGSRSNYSFFASASNFL